MTSLVAAFIAGIFTCLLLVIFCGFMFIRALPLYVLPLNKQIPLKPASKLDWDPHLNKSGWLQISVETLSEHEVGASDSEEQDGNAVDTSNKLASFLLSRFKGEAEQKVRDSNVIVAKWRTVFAVLRQKSLFLYTDETQIECIRVLLILHYKIRLVPEDTPDVDLFNRYNPIALFLRDDSSGPHESAQFFLYCSTSFEKEDWFIILRRVSQLPPFGDEQALSVFYQELQPMREYTDAMTKLIENTCNPDIKPELQATAWLNALMGRIFVAVHTNEHIKEWITARLSRGSRERDESSFLGDIVIQNLHVGNSLPVLSNPKLLSLSIDGDMMIEMDIDYTGGVRLEAATEATLSVPAWDAYMKPLVVPIIVAVKFNRFSARLLLKVKPFWESNRIWFGFYHKPELILELQVEPIISNKLIKLQMVNQVIERRVKQALAEYVMLPNMDNFSFWDFDHFATYDSDSSDAASSTASFEMERQATHHRTSIFQDDADAHIDTDVETHISAALAGEAVESKIQDSRLRNKLSRRSLAKQDSAVLHGAASTDFLASKYREEAPELQSNRYVEQLGEAAFNLGELTRKLGLDKSAKNVAESVVNYTQPAVSFAHQHTVAYSSQIQEAAAAVGISTLEKIGLQKDDQSSPGKSSTADKPPLRSKSSITWNVLGLQVSTKLPQETGSTSKLTRRSRMNLSRSSPRVSESDRYDSVTSLNNGSGKDNSEEPDSPRSQLSSMEWRRVYATPNGLVPLDADQDSGLLQRKAGGSEQLDPTQTPE